MIAATAVIFAAAYLLWALQRIIYNPLTKPENERLQDLNWREIGLLIPLIAAIVMPASSLSVVIAAWRGHTFPESFA